MKYKQKMAQAALYMMVTCQCVNAAEVSSTSFYDELDSLRSQNAVLEEKVKNKELKKKLESNQGFETQNFPTASSLSNKRSAISFDRGARVQFVAGIGGKITATIRLSDGGSTIVRVGQAIPGLGVVRSIRTDEVLVASGKDVYSIPFQPDQITTTPSQSLNGYGQQTEQVSQPGLVVPPITSGAF